MRYRSARPLHIVLALALLLTPAAVGRRPAAADAPTVVRIETSDYDLSSEPYYGTAAGIFARHGITLAFLPAVEGGANMVRDVAAGTADVGFSNLISIAGQLQRGAPIVLIAPAGLYDRSAPVNALVVAPGSTIRSGADLDGAAISSPSGPGSAGALAPAAWIDQHGGDSTTVHFVTGIAPADLPAALASGRVAAGEIGDPQLTILRRLGTIRVLCAPFDAEGDHYLLAGFVASRAWVDAHPDAARAFAAAMRETARWSNEHRAETGAMLAEHLKLPPDVVAAMSRTTFAESLTAEAMQPPLDVAAKYGLIRPMRADDIVRASSR